MFRPPVYACPVECRKRGRNSTQVATREPGLEFFTEADRLLVELRTRIAVSALHEIHAAFHFATWAFAVAATFSAVNPKCFMRSFAGAEAPKPCIPIIAPPFPA